MEWIPLLLFVLFLATLILALWLINSIYVCDHHQCNIFLETPEEIDKSSKDYIEYLLDECLEDGIWEIPFFGSLIAALLIMAYPGVPYTFTNFLLCFLLIFLVIYFCFSFFIHHYLQPIKREIQDVLDNLVCENEAL